MSVFDVHARLEALELAHAQGRDVRAEAALLLAEIPQTSAPPPDDAAALRRKADVVRQHLQLGSLTLPPGCPAALVQLAARHEARVIGPALLRDLAEELERASAETREIEARIRSTEGAIQVGQERTATLRRLLELLDLLVRTDAMEGR